MTRKTSRILGTVLILVNFGYYIPLTIELISSGGGAFAWGLLLLPINIVAHLFLIPAVLTWVNKDEKQTGFLIFNSIGTIWALFWTILFVTAI